MDQSADILQWISRALAALPGVLSIENITVRRAVLVEFLHTSLAGLGRFEPAHHYLRQSISMVETLKLGDRRALEAFEPAERARRQRLYYLIFVHERYFALFHHHLISMVPTDWLPEFDTEIPREVSLGFNQLICLFRHMDEEMINAWLSVTNDEAMVDPEWIQKKHRELEDELAGQPDHIAVSRPSIASCSKRAACC